MTRRVALIGNPLRRRHSEVMHNAAFAAHGIDARFELRELADDEVPAFVEEARGEDWLGFGITAPYKQRIMELIDDVEPAAAAIGAVNNTVRTEDGRIIGFNTDSIGFAASVRDDLGVAMQGARVVMVGAGGAAHAVAFACLDGGAASLTVANRNAERAEQMLLRLAPGADHVAVCPLEGAAFDEAIAEADLLVNATTVGMVDQGVPVAPEGLPDGAAVFDLVYAPIETELLARARARGLNACNGAGMLVAQGVAAFTRWTGVADTTEVMRAAVEPLLQDPAARG